MTAPAPGVPLLEVDDLRVEFPTSAGTLHAVNGVSLRLSAGETLGIVGESGCGKSTIAMALMRLVAPPGRITSGRIRLDGTDLLTLGPAELRAVRGSGVAMIFQDPMSALNPVLTLGRQIREALSVHTGLRGRAMRERVVELLDLVGIPDPRARADAYPHELSGGMRQRVMIAMAISCEPKLLIADEPTTALDVTVQAQILDLLRRLRTELGMAIILVSHDLGVVAGLADRISVMYAGYQVENGTAEQLLLHPRHPYTTALIDSLARIDEPRPHRLRAIPGSAPTLYAPAACCPFEPRCGEALPACGDANPALAGVGAGQRVACWARAPLTGAPAPLEVGT
ncbi:ABC transporter ATP-binding protein [Streptosporangium sp. NPDC051022]|uniref:ABC transporter ATP-binding protein n=1 Tax=Streptosporangium sp. NPDC051022 TaxID=3155752 RepID=UPI00343D3B1F